MVSWAIISFDVICLAGLYAYIRSLAVFTTGFWCEVVLVLIARISLLAPLFLFNLFPWEPTTEHLVALFSLLSILFSIPLLLALWRYAFKSPAVWREVATAHV